MLYLLIFFRLRLFGKNLLKFLPKIFFHKLSRNILFDRSSSMVLQRAVGILAVYLLSKVGVDQKNEGEYIWAPHVKFLQFFLQLEKILLTRKC